MLPACRRKNLKCSMSISVLAAKMTAEDLIQQILTKHPEVNRNQILEKMETEKNKTGGLIADETLLRLIAAKYGIETIKHEAIRKLPISCLVAGLNDVTVTGRVVAVYPPRTFEGKKSGKVANLMIADKDATIRVVLWNDKVDLVESSKLETGQIVRFSHGYTRDDWNGKVELHLSGKGQIEFEPSNVKEEEYPSIGKFTTKINEITAAHDNIHLTGTVKAVFPKSTFTKSDMSTGTVMRFTLADETGEIPVVVWNEKAEELEKSVKVNANLQLANAKVKENGNGELEVHVDLYTYVEASEHLDF